MKTEKELEEQRKILQSIIDKAHTQLVYLDTDFNFVAVDSNYAEACRLSPEELIGKNHFFLFPHKENEKIFRQVRDTGRPVSYKDKPFVFPAQPERGVTYWDWTLSPVFNDAQEIKSLVFSLVETTERKRSEEQKDFLMKELNHRVKNNLAMISSLISLKGASLGPDFDLSDISNQINAIEKITIQLKIAVPIGLIINEFATNDVKYGFTAEEARFFVGLKEDNPGEQYKLTVFNTGNPFPVKINLDNPKPMGLRLISALVDQLNGSIEIQRKPPFDIHNTVSKGIIFFLHII